MRTPSASDAKAVLSLAAWTLVLLPEADADGEAAWRAAASHASANGDATGEGNGAATLGGVSSDAVAATAHVEAIIAAEGCVDNAAADSTGAVSAMLPADRCALGRLRYAETVPLTMI